MAKTIDEGIAAAEQKLKDTQKARDAARRYLAFLREMKVHLAKSGGIIRYEDGCFVLKAEGQEVEDVQELEAGEG